MTLTATSFSQKRRHPTCRALLLHIRSPTEGFRASHFFFGRTPACSKGGERQQRPGTNTKPLPSLPGSPVPLPSRSPTSPLPREGKAPRGRHLPSWHTGKPGKARKARKARGAGLSWAPSWARVPVRPAGSSARPFCSQNPAPLPSRSPAGSRCPRDGDTGITKPGGATAALTCPAVASCPRRWRRRKASAGFASGYSLCRGARARRQRRRAHAPP